MFARLSVLVLLTGVEPARESHWILSPARLPVPPQQHIGRDGRIRTYAQLNEPCARVKVWCLTPWRHPCMKPSEDGLVLSLKYRRGNLYCFYSSPLEPFKIIVLASSEPT